MKQNHHDNLEFDDAKTILLAAETHCVDSCAGYHKSFFLLDVSCISRSNNLHMTTSLAAPSIHAINKTSRIQSIDFLRGAVMILEST